jgi:hypothetical protein
MFVRHSITTGALVKVVGPMLDYRPTRPPGGARLCSFPLSLYPGQAASDGQGCGNGILADGSLIWGNDPTLAGVPNSPALQEAWVRAVVAAVGPAAKGGVRFYSLDNEPGLWSSTHRDFKPRGVGYDELARRSIDYASAIKRADPGAQVMGLVAWGVKELAGSSLDYYGQGPDAYRHPDQFGPGDQRFFDRKRHGGLALVDWYLKTLRQAGESAGRRLIDYLDVHWYPETYGRDSQGKLQRLSNDLPYDPALAPQQFDALREFWDPTYVNPDSWTANAENGPLMWKPYHPVIPSLRALAQADYPGTRLAITEYDTGSRSYYHGALLHAVALGIFMDQGLDAANFWYETDPSKYLYWAHRLYSNYDGHGGNVLGWSYQARSSNPDLYAFSTARAGKAFVVLVNRSVNDDIQADITLPWGAKSLRLHLLSEPAGLALVHLKPQAVGGRRATVTVPAFSAALAEFDLGTAP